uniref:SAP30-binding protein n=1 Tax=Opuntia streptacantha TaxID=393608 RepID=A0A7C9F021_OPUST
MASKKKESEAFNLLKFMYQDDDDDMEDAEKDEDEEDQKESEPQRGKDELGADNKDEDMMLKDDDDDDSLPNVAPSTASPSKQLSANSTPKWSNLRPPTPQVVQSSVPELSGPDAPKLRREKPTIVDYGHDDVAMSPEAEEGEILGTSTGRVMFGEELGSANDFPERTPTGNVQITTPKNPVDSPQSVAGLDASQADVVNGTMKESEAEVVEGVNISDKDAKEFDPLDKFLPPPPEEKCSDELQEKINKFLVYKRQGKIFNVEVRNRKDYRNPDFLRHAVRYQEIDEIGSCFSKDVFDPHGYDQSDFYDAIEADMKREMERKEQERKKSQKVDFVSGGTQAGIVAAAQRVALPSPSIPSVPAGGSQSGATDKSTREGRQNKKSKWDKMDGDQRNLLAGAQDVISAAGAHAALLSAANAGAGYAVFAQQKRREAEERRSSDRKDRRS